MTKTTTVQASTVEEATAIALEQLNTTKEKANIEVLSNGGLFDKAEVKVTVEDQYTLQIILNFKTEISISLTSKGTYKCSFCLITVIIYTVKISRSIPVFS